MRKILEIAGVGFLVQACIALVLVIERFSAAVTKLYMFHFEWPQPIFLSLVTVLLFLAYSVMAIAFGAWLARPTGSVSSRIRTAAKWSAGMNVVGVILVGLMILGRLAVLVSGP
jgi:hypothetical protein